VIYSAEISVLVAGSVTTHVEEVMTVWGGELEVTKLRGGLQGILTANSLTLEEAQCQFENS